MRARSSGRVRRGAQITAGVLLLAAPVATAATLNGTSAHDRSLASQASGAASTATTGTASTTSNQNVRRSSRFVVNRKVRYGTIGQTVGLPGRLKSAGAHAPITLQVRRGDRWIAIKHSHTGPRGGFTLHFRVSREGAVSLRVHFRGSSRARASSAVLGRVAALEPTVASWYYDNGGVGTACGFKAAYGVANKTLPCGTKVTFEYGGRKVTATVDDRGPYVAGRTFDLGVSTAAALGMQGVQTIEAS